MKKTQISSNATILLKFIVPSIFYLAFTFAIAGLITEGKYAGALSASFVLVIFGLFIYMAFVRLKHVSIDDEYVFISNYFKTIKISFSELESVSDLSFGGNYQPIFIHFKKRTDFGYSIIFINTCTRYFNFSEQSITKELSIKIKSIREGLPE